MANIATIVTSLLSIGLMSGTSMDGIDAALLKTDGTANNIQELYNVSIDYDPRFKILIKSAEHAVRHSNGDLLQASNNYLASLTEYLLIELAMTEEEKQAKVQDLQKYMVENDSKQDDLTLSWVIKHSTELHAFAVQKILDETNYTAKQIDVIGYHGQTLFHKPKEKISIIVGDGKLLANKLGIRVVNDFRSRDVAAGGQGAPFAPIYHQALAVRDHKVPMVVVNCGGIANITVIKNDKIEDLIGFDTGPGNCLIDRLVRKRTNGKENLDLDGKYARQGVVNQVVLKKLYEQAIIKNGSNYFTQLPPKSLDYNDIVLIGEIEKLSLPDAAATLAAFTAYTIVNSLDLLNIEVPKYWVLSGGGWNNPAIKAELEKLLHNKLGAQVVIMTADAMGWNNQALEAQIFAYLAVRSLQGKPISVPGTTRVPMPLSGGEVHVPAME